MDPVCDMADIRAQWLELGFPDPAFAQAQILTELNTWY
jgi:hypothetical protein